MLQRVRKVIFVQYSLYRAKADILPERVLALAEHNRERFGTLKGVVSKYLDKCGRQWVAMDSLFGKLGFNS